MGQKCQLKIHDLVLTIILLEGIEASFCKASFNCALLSTGGSSGTPRAATIIVTFNQSLEIF
ncbi:hypothetical protein HanIR_Chr15g0764811 [Helianthus annuus]|nr:hypothetical protein HanIR_Chr15g0764811 [Helianthus annuus]